MNLLEQIKDAAIKKVVKMSLGELEAFLADDPPPSSNRKVKATKTAAPRVSRSPEDVDIVIDTVLDALKKSPGSLGIAHLRHLTGYEDGELKAGLHAAREKGLVTVEGERRSMKYLPNLPKREPRQLEIAAPPPAPKLEASAAAKAGVIRRKKKEKA